MSKKYDIINLKLFDNNDIETLSQLDSEFDQHLACMKKHILLLVDKKSKQLAALWIKKLCEISDTNNTEEKQNRNLYSYRLLKNLETDQQLSFPFTQKPPLGALKDFNLLIKYESQMNYESDNQNDENKKILYDLTKENYSESSSSFDLNNIDHQFLNNNYQNQNRKTPKKHDSNPFLLSLNQHNEALKALEENQKISNIYSFDLQLKKLESKFQEEKINIQHQHNNEIQKLLDRKNSEIEKLKKTNKQKLKENEDLISGLEKKIILLEKNLASQQQDSDDRLKELKKETSLILDLSHKDNEKKVVDLINKFEKDKYELQKQHTAAFQDLVEETNLRLKKVETEYNEQQAITDQVVQELENRTILLKREMENNLKVIHKLETENSSLKKERDNLSKTLEEVKIHFEENQSKLKSSFECQIEEIKKQMKIEYTKLKEENEKFNEKNKNLETDLELTKSAYEKKVLKLKQSINEKDLQIQNLNIMNRKQEIQAENAISEIKTQIESDSKKLYDEMKEQIYKVESDLSKSKSLRERQTKESQKQIEKLKSAHDKQIDKLTQEFNEKENALKLDFEEQKKQLVKQRNESLDAMQTKFQSQMAENNQMFQKKIENLTTTISQLETKVNDLQNELFEANSLRKNQIIELALLREDEKMKLIRDKELELETLKFDFDTKEKTLNEKLANMKELHENEIRSLSMKSNMESQRLNELVLRLEEKIKIQNDDIKKMNQNSDFNLNELAQRYEEEKNNIRKQMQIHLMKFEQEKEAVESKLTKAYSDYEHSITKIKMQYEEKQRGLMPNEIRKEYEETINSLKSQIQVLQQRIALLQSELDDRNHLINSSSCTASI